MAEQSDIRDRLNSYLGEKRYARFVGGLLWPRAAARLLFWQERVWERFATQNPDCCLSFSEVTKVFAECPKYGARIRRENYLALVATWLRDEVSVEGLEREFSGSGRWLELKQQYRDGDLFHEFRSPRETWAMMAGRAGIALVRDGKVVDCFVTALN